MATKEAKKKFAKPSHYYRGHTPWYPSYKQHEGFIALAAPGGKQATLPCTADDDADAVVDVWARARGWEPRA